jgi:hypothetical protein
LAAGSYDDVYYGPLLRAGACPDLLYFKQKIIAGKIFREEELRWHQKK